MKCRRFTATLYLVIGLSLIRPIQTETVSYWIWNKGCNARRTHSEDLIVNTTVTDLAQCFDHCDNVTYSVALQGTTCQCVENITLEVDKRKSDCLQCDGEPDIRCGNEASNSWSYYEKVTAQDQEKLSNITVGISTCIAVQYLSEIWQYFGYRCSEKLSVLCYSEVTRACVIDNLYSGGWSESVYTCVGSSMIAVNSFAMLDKCRSYRLINTGVHWIGIRSVMYTKTETTTETSESLPSTSPSTIIGTPTWPSMTSVMASKITTQKSISTPTSLSRTTTPQSIITAATKSTSYSILHQIKHSPSRGSKGKSKFSSTKLPTATYSYTTKRPNQNASVETSKSLKTTLMPKTTAGVKKESTTNKISVQNSTKTRPGEKSVTVLNPPMAGALVVNKGDSDLKTYYAAFGASILVIMILIALFLGLIHRSVRKLVNKDYLMKSRFRHRLRTRSRSPTFLPTREHSPYLESPRGRSWHLPRVQNRDNVRYSAGVNNYGYMWDERYDGDDYYDDDLDDNVLNRNVEDSADFRHANRFRSRQTLQPPLRPSFTRASGRRQWREFL